jgi:hypothetical protein
MEQLSSNPHSLIPCQSLRYCQAGLAEVCVQRGGYIEPDRAANARYCSRCAPLVRRQQSRERKREMRRQDWRKYHNDYSPYDRKQWSVYHRDYMRDWRAGRRRSH